MTSGNVPRRVLDEKATFERCLAAEDEGAIARKIDEGAAGTVEVPFICVKRESRLDGMAAF